MQHSQTSPSDTDNVMDYAALRKARCWDCRVDLPADHPADANPLCNTCAAVRDDAEQTALAINAAARYCANGGPMKVLFALAHDVATSEGAEGRKKIAALLAGTASVSGVFLHSPIVGCGKTYELGRAAWSVCLAGGTMRFLTQQDFQTAIKGTYDNDSALKTTTLLNDLTAVPLLFLDDIGAVHASQHDADRLLELIDRRYESERPTIFSSNLSVHELAQHIAGNGNEEVARQARRIASRIGDCAVSVKLGGATRRGAGERAVLWVTAMQMTERLRRGGLSLPSSTGVLKPQIEQWHVELRDLLPAAPIPAENIHEAFRGGMSRSRVVKFVA